MSDVVSIELLLDAASEAAVRGDWERLAAAGLSSLAAHTSPSNRPHITLLARPSLRALDAAQVDAHLPLPVRLGAPVLFGDGDRRVLARLVVPTRELLDLHRRVHDRAGASTADAAHTAPDTWTPHVTLARRMRLAALAEALELLGPAVDGEAVSLRRWDSASARVTDL